MAEKKKRGPRMPFGQLTGVWTELAQTLRGLKDNTITDVENARVRVYTLNTMLGVVDRILQERAIEELREEVAALKSGPDNARVISTTATMASLPARSPSA